MTSRLDWRILEALDDRVWRASFYAKLAGWPKTGMCWKWQGARDERGFGRVRLPADVGGQTVHPHRVCWLAKHGSVTPGLVLRPTRKGCIGRSCGNPACWSEGPVGLLPGQKEPKIKPATGQRRVDMPTLNGVIHKAIVDYPEWLETVFARLDGYPDPGRCWIWSGAKHERGYGRVRLPAGLGGRAAATHRVVWIALRGPIWIGHVLDHDNEVFGCKNRSCANPAHLQSVREWINIVGTGRSPAARNARKARCPRGHKLNGDNLVLSSLRRGQRQCLTCARESGKARSEAAKIVYRGGR